MEIKMINDQKQWNNFLLSRHSQVGIFLQSWEWGEFQQAMGRKVYRLVHSSQFTVHSFAQIIEMPLPFGQKYWYIPRGEIFEGIIKEARRCGALFVRIEPPHKSQITNRKSQITNPIQPKQTLIVDISKSEDELLAGMREKTRYNIRLAQRKGVVHSSQFTVHSFNDFWKLLQETSKRDMFQIYPREYYEKMLVDMGTWEHDNMATLKARLWIAYYGTTPVASAIVAYFGDTATYLHGASSYEYRALMGSYALHWDIIKDAKKQGYRSYDLWGIDEKKWPGITRFKMGFNGAIVNYPGAFDLSLNKLWYKVYRLGKMLLP